MGGTIGGISGNLSLQETRQSLQHEIAVETNQDCSPVCTTEIKDISIVVIGGTGDIVVSQICTASSECQQSAAVDVVVRTIFDAFQKSDIQGIPTIGGVSLGVTRQDSEQQIREKVEAFINQRCNAVASLSAERVNIVVIQRDGNIAFNQAGDARSACNMSAATDVAVETKVQSGQVSTIGSSLLPIIALIIAIVIVIIIFYFIIRASGNAGRERRMEEARLRRIERGR